MFLPGRMDVSWGYEKGINMGDPITFDNIEIINNFEIQIQKAGELNECYLLGCYFGNLYLLDKQTFNYTKYFKLEEASFLYLLFKKIQITNQFTIYRCNNNG